MELAGTVRGFEEWCFQDSIGARRWERFGLPLDAHQQNPIRLARQRFCKHGEAVIVELLLKCIQAVAEDEKTVGYTASGKVIQAAKIHTHVQFGKSTRSAIAHSLDPKNHLQWKKKNNVSRSHLIMCFVKWCGDDA